jgi:hypothetical protein
MEPFVPTPLCASSPSLAVVTVAAGASVTVVVNVTGVVSVVVVKGDIVRGLDVEICTADVAELVDDALIIEGLEIRIHPFGEQMEPRGQHPPPRS